MVDLKEFVLKEINNVINNDSRRFSDIKDDIEVLTKHLTYLHEELNILRNLAADLNRTMNVKNMSPEVILAMRAYMDYQYNTSRSIN